jgi:hypothetical protein
MYGILYPRVYMGRASFNKDKLLQKVSKRRKKEMFRTKIVCLTLLSVLLITVCCQVGYSADTVLTLDDLPSSGESATITSDGILTVEEGETAVIKGVLQINGTEDAITELKIVNNGELTITSTTIRCNHANLTIHNSGFLTLETFHLTVTGNSTFAVNNEDDCLMIDTSVDVYGGYLYFTNRGELTVQNGYFKDQFDGTFISNYGEAGLFETTLVANGAEGKIELYNGGELLLRHGVFDVNYGGTVNMNSVTGNLTMTECSIDVSGASHGKRSAINILGNNATLESCTFVNNDGLIDYLNTGEVSLINCTLDVSAVNSSTILSSSGPMVFENFLISGSGSTSITNGDSMTFIDSDCNSSHSLTFMNNGELNAENWLVKTTSDTARIVVYNGDNGTITFDVPFIEDVSSSVLASIGSEGQEFVEDTGGTIAVTNYGSINERSSADGGFDSILIYVLAIVAAAVVAVVVVFFVVKKRKRN